MAFTSFRLYNFRNLQNATVRTERKDVFLVGENGQGKTNFLEAVYFTCYGSSFRTRRDDALIQNGSTEMAVEAEFHRDPDTQRLLVKQLGRKKTIELNGKNLTDRKELISTIPCIVFCHDDIAFVTGAPEMQRWFLNQTLSLINPSYLDALRRYNRILRSRNAVLRSGQVTLLDALDIQLAEAGLPLIEWRREMNGRFSELLTRLFGEVFGGTERLRLDYRASWRSETPGDEIRDRRDTDVRMSTTTSGPHRDRFVFRLGDKPLVMIGSTGQLRLVSLILRVAQARFVHDALDVLPVLLLDDVLLELDPGRRLRFVDALPEYEQAFFTFLPDEQYARFRAGSTRTFRVEGGILHEES